MALAEEFTIKTDYRDSVQGLDELALSIKNDGLYNPITVKPTEDNLLEVVAGRRRFRAMTQYLGWTSLKKNSHYIVKEGVDALIAQFQENFNREDFTPAEMARLVRDIHEQQTAIHGPAIKGQSGGWGLKDTGRIIGRDSAFISRMLSIAENEDEVKDCKSVSEALEKVDKKKTKDLRSKIQKAQYEKRESSASPDLEALITQVQPMKAEDYIATIEDESIDLVLTDPPYGIDYSILYKGQTYQAYEDDPEDLFELLQIMIPSYYRALKDGKYCIIWTAFEHYQFVSDLMESAGFKVAATPILWVKMNSPGKSLNPHKTLASQAEVAVYGWKGDAELALHGRGNVFPVQVVRSADRIHVAQKPDRLYQDILQIFSYKNDRVLDTFAGSLACLRACFQTGRDFLGCEMSEDYLMEAVNYTRDEFAGGEDDKD